jgi:hypothetical protein
LNESHIEDWVQDKERGNVECKIIVTHNLGDGVWPISEWSNLLMGPCWGPIIIGESILRLLIWHFSRDDEVWLG